MPEPKLLRLVEVVKDGPPKFNGDALDSVLSPVLDMQLQVVSIMGEDNSRRSLLLDSMFSYLDFVERYDTFCDWSESTMKNRGDEWANAESKAGVWVWNRPLILTVEKKKQMAVLLIDCQESGETSKAVSMLNTYLTLRLADVQLINFDSDSSAQRLEIVEMLAEMLKSRNELAVRSLTCIANDGTGDGKRGDELSGKLDAQLKELQLDSGQAGPLVSLSRFVMPSPGSDILTKVSTSSSMAHAKVAEQKASSSEPKNNESEVSASLAPEMVEPPCLLPESELMPEGADDESPPDSLLPEHMQTEMALTTSASYSAQSTVLVGSLIQENSSDVKEANYSEATQKDFSFPVKDADSGFVDASQALFSQTVSEMTGAKREMTGRKLIRRFVDLKDSFEGLEDSCSSGAEACEDVITKNIYSQAMVNYEKNIQEYGFQNESGFDEQELEKWQEQQIADADKSLSSNKVLKLFGNSAISRKLSAAIKKDLSTAKKDLFYVRSGLLVKNTYRALKTATGGEKTELKNKLSALYKDLGGRINTIRNDHEYADPVSACSRAQRLFISGLDDELDAQVSKSFCSLFTDRSGRGEVAELELEMGETSEVGESGFTTDLVPEGQDDAQPDALPPSEAACGEDSGIDSNFKPKTSEDMHESVESRSLWDYLDQPDHADQKILSDAMIADMAKMCTTQNVADAICMQSPTDSKQVVIFGVNAGSIPSSALSGLQQTYPDFSFYANNFSNPFFTELFSWKVNQETAQAEIWKANKSITSELIVSATEKYKANPDSGTTMCAVVPAHSCLDLAQCTSSALGERSIRELRTEVEGKTSMHRYILDSGTGHSQDLCQPILFHHQHWYRSNEQATADVFMQDIALLRLTEFNSDESQKGGPPPSLQCTEKDLRLLEQTGLKVVVCGAEGHLVPSPRSLGCGEKKYGCHLAFVTSSMNSGGQPKELGPGDSGSIVFLIGKGGRLLPFGMLIGRFSESLPGCDAKIYQAVILSAGFAALETDYPHHLKQIQMLHTSQ